MLTEILLCHYCFLLSPEALSHYGSHLLMIMTMVAGLALRALVSVGKCGMAPVRP